MHPTVQPTNRFHPDAIIRTEWTSCAGPSGRLRSGILPDIGVPKDLPASQEDDKALALAFKLLRETTAPHQKG